MEPDTPLVPPVVAVMVVHEPGDWFDRALDGLAQQDYPNLKRLFLVAGGPGDVPDRIRARVPSAFVRATTAAEGFGRAANEVMTLVEGENGFFCFLHDDVALDPSAIRLLVEEMFRSNAGIVGPKLVSWDDPNVLQHVGFAVDRFGEIDPLVEPGELDQEQHDAVRDVFALPSACMLVRADLFRTLGGFDETIDFHGDDLDLCWRAHLGAARVIVVPSARARHREALVERRPDLAHRRLLARHRMRTVVTLVGARRLPLLSLQMLLITVAELIVGVFTGTAPQAWASLRALVGLVPRTPSIIARRRVVAVLRQVPDREVAGLQLRGSARLSSYLRSRDMAAATRTRSGETRIRWRERSGGDAVVAWMCVLVAIVIGSRRFLADGVPAFGEFLRFPSSPAAMLGDYRSGWWGHGLGATSAVPTAIGLIAVASVLTLFHMGLLQTLAVVGLLVAGAAGLWRLVAMFPSSRARITAFVVYAALPLPAQAISAGRWGGLACYAALPWAIHLLRSASGIDIVAASRADAASSDELIALSSARRIRVIVQLGLLVAVTTAFVPSFLVLFMGVALVLVASGASTGRWGSDGTWRAIAAALSATAGAVAVAAVLNGPWLVSLVGDGGWSAVIGAPIGADDAGRGLGVGRLAWFGIGHSGLGAASLALYLPVLVAPLVARGWRFAWAVRAGALVVVFGWLAVLDDRRSLPIRLPEPAILLVPVAVGLAIAAGCTVAAFHDDIRGGSFGWRQPLTLLSVAALVVGVVPGVLAVGSGRWDTPRTTLVDLLDQLPTNPPDGDYRVLFVGDARVLPLAGWGYRDGMAYAIADDGPLTVAESWPGRPSEAEQSITSALDAAATGTTTRVGRLLAPLAIRYVVVPVDDGSKTALSRSASVPDGLVDAFGDQLDLSIRYSALNFLLFENHAWIPTRSELTATGAEASGSAGADALARADLSGALPLFVGTGDRDPADAVIAQGSVHLAVPADDRWHLVAAGTEVPAHNAFGSTMAFDVPTSAEVHLEYRTSPARTAAVVFQALLWLLAVGVAGGMSLAPWRRRRDRSVAVTDGAPILAFGATSTVAPIAIDAPAVFAGDDEIER